MFKNLPVVRELNSFLNKLKALNALLGYITVKEDYIEVVLPENVVVTSTKHLAIRTPNGKLLLNPKLSKGRTLDDHVAFLKAEHKRLLEIELDKLIHK